MKTNFVSLFIIWLSFSASVCSAEALPDVEQKGKPISYSESEEVEGAEEQYAMESSSRAETTYPTNYGHPGLFRVRSAQAFPEGSLTFGIGGEFYAVTDGPVGGSAHTIAESIFVGYTPVENLSLGVMRRNSSTTYGNPSQLSSSLGDINLTGLYSFELSPSFRLAPLLDILVASNYNSLTPVGRTMSVGVGAAATMSLYPSTGVPILAHANLIYHMPQIRGGTAAVEEAYYGFSRLDTVTVSLGAEYNLGTFIPFFEFNQTFHASSNLTFGSQPSELALGTRILPFENKGLAFLVGVDIGLGRGLAAGVPFQPGYQILGQVSYTFGLTQSERKHYYATSDVNVVNRKFVIRKDIKFKVGSAELTNDSYPVLNQIADVIKKNKVNKLLIVGHTDSSHGEDYNLKLSQDRAATVKKYLVQRGVADDTLSSQGYGKRKPKASNATEEGRALNRRVEFFILE